MYGHHLHFDELQATGHKIRLKNKLKAKQLMTLSVNFIDPGVLRQFEYLLSNLSPQTLEQLKRCLDDKTYLSAQAQGTPALGILEEMAKIALCTTPKDETLRSLLAAYQQNLDAIDELKLGTTRARTSQELTPLMETMHKLYDSNMALLEQVNQYRESRTSC
jgi:hypothetical protein